MVQHHKTNPEYYGSQLSDEASQHRANLEKKLTDLYENLNECESPIEEVKLQRVIDRCETQLAFQGANPKHVDFDELKEHIRLPIGDAIENKYRARISSRATGIRAFCVQCQGGEVAGVRSCPAVTCPLHPFRMGSDPLRGWAMPKVDEPEIEFEDGEVDNFEDTDDAD